MVKSLQHESFYVTGTWGDESLGVYAGWVARKSPTSDQMPLRSGTGETVLIFAGEEFSSPEPLVRRAEETSFLPGLNGRFHGLLASQTTSKVTLFNDRYGMHRMYYHEEKDAFYFAAEAKAILAVRPELRSVDTKSMAELITCGCVLNNRTVFKGIHVLPPASEWIFKDAAIVRKGAYFNPKEWEDQETLDEESYYRQLKDVFSRKLPHYFSGPERIGVSLTGGLDSRMIMAWHKAAPQSLPCYSFGGMFRDCQDVVMARKVALVCQQPHQIIPVGQEFLTQFPHYSERTVYLTDGCSDVSHASDLYINEIARGIAPIRMTGNYGGEVLRSVRAFKPMAPPPGLFRADVSPYIEEAKKTYSGLVHCHPLSFAVFRQAPWHHYSLQALEQTQIALRSPYLDNDFVRTVYRAPKSTLSSNDISLRLIADGNEALRRIRTDRGLGGNYGWARSAILHNYLEFTFKAEYAYDYGMPQWVARIDHTFSQLHLERLFLGRHKFYHFRVWYRDTLSSYIREMLLDSRTLSRPYLEPKTVETMVNGHLRGSRNYTTAIHKMLTLEHLHRLFIDSK